MARIHTFLHVAADQRASDLHFHAGKPPMVRYDGDLIPLPFRDLSEEETRRLVFEILSPPQKVILDEELEIDFSYQVEGVGRFRANVFQQNDGLSAVFRVIPEDIVSLSDLGMPPAVRELGRLARGLVLVSGPTGSGKTTTLAAIVRDINESSQRHILTIEDPIEYMHEPVQCVVTQREVGTHVASFEAGLRSALREAPDVIVLGELRDYETIGLALSAAEAGVLVFATLHANSAAKAIDRLIGACPLDVQDQVRAILSVQLKGCVAQRLCRLATGGGRVAAVEILLHSYSVAHLIRENKIHQLDAYLGSGESAVSGARSLDAALAELVRSGLVTADEASQHARDPEIFERPPPGAT